MERKSIRPGVRGARSRVVGARCGLEIRGLTCKDLPGKICGSVALSCRLTYLVRPPKWLRLCGSVAYV